MTSLPARQFGLEGRGTIASKQKADIIVFRPEAVRDRAGYAEPHRLAEGMECVLVNGVMTVARGQWTGERGGQFL
jgi:N-acyl-D-amino-acid deacylase